MRLQPLLVLGTFLTFSASKLIHEPETSPQHSSLYDVPSDTPNVLLARDPPPPGAVNVDAAWETAWCKGTKLALAMLKPEASAASYITPIRSPWDGTLAADFATWGYREIDNYRNLLCDFSGSVNNLERAFAELTIGTASADKGGPSKCFHVEYQYGPTVELDRKGKKPAPDK